MYLEHWQLTSKPFEPIADRNAFYLNESIEGSLFKLRYAIESRRPAMALVGPPGVGKSLVAKLLVDELDEAFRPCVHLVFPQMSSRDLLVYLAEQLGAPPADPPMHTIEESVRRLEFFVSQNARQGRHAIVVIDEAHLLEDCGTLETLRLLLNFEHDSRAALSLVLVGQMGLIAAIGRTPGLEERLSAKALLRSFTPEESAAYVERRLSAAGAQREIFSSAALESLHYLSNGIPRKINRLADLALVVGFADRLPRIDAEQVKTVNGELVSVGVE